MSSPTSQDANTASETGSVTPTGTAASRVHLDALSSSARDKIEQHVPLLAFLTGASTAWQRLKNDKLDPIPCNSLTGDLMVDAWKYIQHEDPTLSAATTALCRRGLTHVYCTLHNRCATQKQIHEALWNTHRSVEPVSAKTSGVETDNWTLMMSLDSPLMEAFLRSENKENIDSATTPWSLTEPVPLIEFKGPQNRKIRQALLRGEKDCLETTALRLIESAVSDIHNACEKAKSAFLASKGSKLSAEDCLEAETVEKTWNTLQSLFRRYLDQEKLRDYVTGRLASFHQQRTDLDKGGSGSPYGLRFESTFDPSGVQQSTSDAGSEIGARAIQFQLRSNDGYLTGLQGIEPVSALDWMPPLREKTVSSLNPL